MRGSFITFEGGEGSGKSTQVKLLCEALRNKNLPHIATREPGGTESAERIRQLLVSGSGDAWKPTTETLLFYAARVEHVERLLKPALEEGTHVVCDRFADSTLVYQGAGKDLSEYYVQMLHKLTLGNFAPDLTFILDISPQEGLKRANTHKHNEKRFELMPMDFHRRVRAGFLGIAAREPKRCIVLDATQDMKTLHTRILNAVSQRLGVRL